jgi:hypothetical protein
MTVGPVLVIVVPARTAKGAAVPRLTGGVAPAVDAERGSNVAATTKTMTAMANAPITIFVRTYFSGRSTDPNDFGNRVEEVFEEGESDIMLLTVLRKQWKDHEARE